MNRIKTRVDPDTNYVFHMMSVACCGYDNDYGKKHRNLHGKASLCRLNAHSELLTVRGGEHCGKLYGELVARPASAVCPADRYYNEILKAVRGELAVSEYFDTAKLRKELAGFTREIAEIAEVMRDNYTVYIENVWGESRCELEAYAQGIKAVFEDSGFTDSAEALVGQKLEAPAFTATLCNSVAYGAEAIDISRDQDVFGIERSYDDAFYFIGHEFIIYLLMQALQGTKAFTSFDTWSLTEGMAEFYLKKITGSVRFFDENQLYADYYAAQFADGKPHTAAELFARALDEFGQ